MFDGRLCTALGILLVLAISLLLAGCDPSGHGRTAVDGYWKGKMVEEIITDRASTAGSWANELPRQILLRLEESDGIVQGRLARSSDAIAFRQIDNAGSRQVSAYAVTGTLDGSRFRIRFSVEAGGTYEVDAVVAERVIAGSYVAQYSTDSAKETRAGRFSSRSKGIKAQRAFRKQQGFNRKGDAGRHMVEV